MEKSRVASCHLTVVRSENDESAEGETGEGEIEETMPTLVASPLSGPDDDITVKMAGIEMMQKHEFEVTTESSSRITESIRSEPVPSLKPASTSRSSEAREVHHVTFAEPCNKYVHSDSGIVLSPDDTDFTDVITGTSDEHDLELSDDECDDAEGGDVKDKYTTRFPPLNTNAVPGPPIIKLHRCRSTESHDNPFLSDGELSRKADYIVTHSTFLRTYVRVADPDQITVETESSREADCIPSVENIFQTHFSPAAADPSLELSTEVDRGNIRSESPAATPQRIISKVGLEAPPRQNGEVEEPLLASKKEGNGLGRSKNKQTRSKGVNCCVVQ